MQILRWGSSKELHAAEIECVLYRYIVCLIHQEGRAIDSYDIAGPEDACEQKYYREAQKYCMRGANSVPAGDEGQTVKQFRDWGYRSHLLFPPVLVVAVVPVFKLLQVPEVLGQRQLH